MSFFTEMSCRMKDLFNKWDNFTKVEYTETCDLEFIFSNVEKRWWDHDTLKKRMKNETEKRDLHYILEHDKFWWDEEILDKRLTEEKLHSAEIDLEYIFSHPEIKWDEPYLVSRMKRESHERDLNFVFAHPEMDWDEEIITSRIREIDNSNKISNSNNYQSICFILSCCLTIIGSLLIATAISDWNVYSYSDRAIAIIGVIMVIFAVSNSIKRKTE